MHMKSNFYLRMTMFLVIAIAVGFTAEAQPRGNSSHGYKKSEKHGKSEKKKYREHETAYRYSESDHMPYRHYDYDRHGNGKKIYRRYESGHPAQVYTYRHPQYGLVYRSFNSVPVRLKYQGGYYYFHGGHYYRLYPEVGYVRVEAPRAVVFQEIPSHSVRVRIGGERYYRYGELVFERYDYGYRLAPPSVSINLNF